MSDWINSRKEFLKKTKQKIKSRLGQVSEDLQQYTENYKTDTNSDWIISSKDELIQSLKGLDVVFSGDFHALVQSQKTHLRLMKEFIKNRSLVLAVEFFESKNQLDLENFLKNKMDEKQFLEKILWNSHWGFPWENYKILIDWVRKNHVPVFGLNKYFKKRNQNSLEKRDRHSALLINQIRNEHPDSLVFVIFGELHIAKQHIPLIYQKKKKKDKIGVIYQNIDSVYFDLLESGLESQVDVVRFSENRFCVCSAAPWIKWQSYFVFLDQSTDLDAFESDSEEKKALDCTDYVARYVKWFSDELDFNVSFDDFEVFSRDDEIFWERLSHDLKKSEVALVKNWVAQGKSFYLPGLKIGYITTMSINHITTIAAKHFFTSLIGFKKPICSMPKEFLIDVWIECVTYFLTKLVNHKRKTDTLFDIKVQINQKTIDEYTKDTLLLVLDQKMTDLYLISKKKRFVKPFKPRQKSNYWDATRLLGGLLGEKLYNGYRIEKISKDFLRHLIQKSIDKDFMDFYSKVLLAIESSPTFFRSKTERL